MGVRGLELGVGGRGSGVGSWELGVRSKGWSQGFRIQGLGCDFFHLLSVAR